MASRSVDRATHPNAETQAAILLEFIEVVIHQILFLRKVYPAKLFDEVRIYQRVHVHQCRHPKLNDYIHQTVEDIRPWLLHNQVERVVVVLHQGSDDEAAERWIIRLHNFGRDSSLTYDDYQNMLQGSIEKLMHTCQLQLSLHDPTFTIVVHTTGTQEMKQHHTWIDSEPSQELEDVASAICAVKSYRPHLELFVESRAQYLIQSDDEEPSDTHNSMASSDEECCDPS
mmetsp:Transcript_44351/g.111740  ORF Transcript_44351/g.111740 Transcript_44351/m.111740 type:complete len:228 (-) Transcript_44351:80-763(-)